MNDTDPQPAPEEPGEDRLEALEKLASRLPEAMRERDAGDALRAANDAVGSAETDISALERVAGITALVRETIEAEDRSRLERDLRQLAQAGRTIAAAVNAETLEPAMEKLLSLHRGVPFVERTLTHAWAARVERIFASSGGLGRVLEEIPETQKIGKQMRDIHQAATSLKHRRDDAAKLAGEFDGLEARLQSLRADLTKVGAGSEAIDFLLAVSEGRATLSLLTDDVRSWLSDRDALPLFKVSL